MKLINCIKLIWYSIPLECFKGKVRGKIIKLTNPKRYKLLKLLMPPYSLLVKQRKSFLTLLNSEFQKEKIIPLKIFCRIKTIGGLDRKERYCCAIHPNKIKECLGEDFLGLTIVTRSKQDCYKFLSILKKIGEFLDLKDRKNPRDHFQEPAYSRETKIKLKNRIHGNLSIIGFVPIHIRIMTKETYIQEIIDRGNYKRAIWKLIKKQQSLII